MVDLIGLKILIVEDVRIQQKVAEMTLTALNCEVTIATTGAEALHLYTQNHYDLILMDLGLDDMDGFTLTQSIRKTNQTIPIIALTAHDDKDYLNKCYSVGMNDFLEKPMTLEVAQKVLVKWGLKSPAVQAPNSNEKGKNNS